MSDSLLEFLYGTSPGRLALKAAARPGVSAAAGRFMDSRLSAPLIGPFIRKNKIPLGDYLGAPYRSFNEFFTRPIRPELRPFPAEAEALPAPCDGLLSAYRITEDTVLPIKQSLFTVPGLLGGDPAAESFQNGVCLVFRLCVDHYHRYCYIDDGVKGENVFLPGQLHTVRPVALSTLPVFERNCREYTLMDTVHFGRVAQIEVGAMLVGRIRNHHGAGPVARGAEKGMFLYGGSTVVLLLEKDRVVLPESLFESTAAGRETPVRLGQTIGRAAGP